MNKLTINLKRFASVLGLTGIVATANAAEAAPFTGVSDINMLYILSSIGLIMLILVFVLANIIKSITANKEIWHYMQDKKGKVTGTAILIFILGTPFLSMAQDAAAVVEPAWRMSSNLFWAIVILDTFLIVVVFYLFTVLKQLVATLKAESGVVADASTHEVVDSWTASLTDSVPLEREEEIMMDHEYDGIKELDNNLPPWWVWGFYATIIFSFAYLIYYHVLEGPSSKQEYIAEVETAEAEKAAYMATMANAVDETNVTLVTDATVLASAKELFTTNCAACHGANGGSMPGGVGPNLTDEYWIHGGDIKDIFKTIKYGVPAKGMISWESQLSPSQMQNMASYILSLQGTNPENAKEPQGDLYAPEASEEQPEQPSNDSATDEAPATEENSEEAGDDIAMK